MKNIFANLVALIAIVFLGSVAYAAVPLPTPDPSFVCDSSTSVSISKLGDVLAAANNTFVDAVTPDNPSIVKALAALKLTANDVPAGITKIVGFIVDTPDGSGVYFAHPFDENCVAGAALQLGSDYTPPVAPVAKPGSTTKGETVTPDLGINTSVEPALPWSGTPQVQENTKPLGKRPGVYI